MITILTIYWVIAGLALWCDTPIHDDSYENITVWFLCMIFGGIFVPVIIISKAIK